MSAPDDTAPASRAPRTLASASSTTTHCSTGTPRAAAAARNASGCGLRGPSDPSRTTSTRAASSGATDDASVSSAVRIPAALARAGRCV